MQAYSFPARIPFSRLCCAVFIVAAVLSTDAKNRRDEERPEWIAQPKSGDSMYLYVVGHAAGQPSETEAQDAAYRNALQKIAAQIPAPDGKPAPPTRIQRAEVVPGCRYVEKAGSRYEAWVQVSWPAAEKQKLIRQPAPARSSSGAGERPESIGREGGVVEDRGLGVTVTIPPGAVEAAVPITIRRAENSPPPAGAPMPSTLASRLYLGPILDLGPSATRFDQPVNVRIKWPELAGLDPEQFAPEVGWYDGATWQPLETVNFKDGELSFNTDHFSLFWPVVGVVGAAVAWYELQQWANVWKTPEILITPDKMPQTHLDKIKLPGKLEFPLNLPQCGFNTFKGVKRPAVFPANGATMVTRKSANCWDCCNYVASVLLAKNDARFKFFKIVQGKVTVTNRAGQRETGDHAWIELKVGGKVYVLDTTHPNDLVFIPRAEACRRDNLAPVTQWDCHPNSSRPYMPWDDEQTAASNSPAAPSGAGGASGTYPAEPFNGMQITYTLSGVKLGASKDKSGFTCTRTQDGEIAGDRIQLSGTSKMGGGFGADVTVRLWAGNEEKTYTNYVASGSPGFNSVSYNLTVPVANGAATGGFSIQMDGHYSMGGGHRGLVVNGTLKSSSDSQPGNSTPASGTQRDDPTTVVKDRP
ncbi:MAG: hypothetical protein WC381_07340 [Kiritimatiellia bacterium]|jgi:hypothetical protein